MSLDLPALSAAVAREGRVARVLVLKVAGSTPREGGAAMLVWAAGQDGTIGGGALEFRAVAAARELLARGGLPPTLRMTLPLGPDLGQCCGGAVTLAVEVFDAHTLPRALPYARPLGRPGGPVPPGVARRLAALPPFAAPIEVEGWLIETAPRPRRPLWIWGAGHVGRAIAQVMAPLPDVAVTVIDPRPDWLAGLAGDVTPRLVPDPPTLVAEAPARADHLVLTHSHALDLALCHALLSRPFASVGLIGSASKWARFRSRLAALGHQPEQIARIACPIGDPGWGKHPQAIALSVAAVLMAARAGATRKQAG
jgi:xanthine dehydrogenase accessory factor